MRENQIGQKVITLKGILNLMLRFWVAVLVIMILCAGVMGFRGVSSRKKKAAAQSGQTEKEIKIKIDEKGFLNVKGVTDYEALVAERQQYLDESLLMKIDPMHKWNGNIRYRFTLAEEKSLAESGEGITDEQRAAFEAKRQQLANAYLGAFRAQENYDRIMELSGLGSETSYLNEIMGAEVTSIPGTFYVWAYGADRDQMTGLLDAIESAVGEMGAAPDKSIGAYEVTAERTDAYELVDTALADTLAAKQADLANQQTTLATKMGQLNEDEAAYLAAYRKVKDDEGYVDGMTLTETREVKAISENYQKVFLTEAAKGLGIGLGVSFLLVFLIYLFTPVVLSMQSITDMYDLPVYADGSARKTGGEQTKLMKELILGAGQKETVALVSSDGRLLELPAAAGLMESLKEAGTTITAVSDINVESEALRRLNGVSVVYLVEKCGRSRHKKIEKELLFLRELGIRTGGVFLV